MRFLIGLLTGAALILALNGELRHGKVVALAGSMWSVLVSGTADYLFPAVYGVKPEAATGEAREPQRVPGASPAAAGPPLQAPPPPAPALEPVLAPALEPVPTPALAPRLEIASAPASAPAPAPAPSAPPVGDPERVVALAAAAPTPEHEATEFVWQPFHSKISAKGFANRLALSLDHPFDVHRQGPGRYRVGFNYGSDEERALLVEQIAQITGTSR